MGAGPDPRIVGRQPVDQVVPAFVARARVVGDLVGRQPGIGEYRLGVLEEPGLVVLRRQYELALAVEPVEHRATLDGELIDREMRAGMFQRPGEFPPPALSGLAGPGVYQVERDALEQRTRGGDRFESLVHAVLPAERGEPLRVQGLHAERQAADAGRAKGGKPGRLHRCRVGLQGDLDVVRGVPACLGGLDRRGDGLGRHQRRGAAAEKDGLQPAARRQPGEVTDLGDQRIAPAPLVDRGLDMAVEVAIGAFGPAERPVDVEAERAGVGREA